MEVTAQGESECEGEGSEGWTEEEVQTEEEEEEEEEEDDVMSAFSMRLVQEAQRVLGCIEHWDEHGKPSEGGYTDHLFHFH